MRDAVRGGDLAAKTANGSGLRCRCAATWATSALESAQGALRALAAVGDIENVGSAQ